MAPSRMVRVFVSVVTVATVLTTMFLVIGGLLSTARTTPGELGDTVIGALHHEIAHTVGPLCFAVALFLAAFSLRRSARTS